MGKGKKKQNKDIESNCSSNTLPLLELRYAEPLFQMACHPTLPLIYSGLATGHLYCHEYDVAVLGEISKEKKLQHREETSSSKPWLQVDAEKQNDANSGIHIKWKTKRHNGSVRCLCLDPDGEYIYSVGADNILKKANSENGRVLKKVNLNNEFKFTKMIHSGQQQHNLLLLGDEGGNVLVLDTTTLKLKNKMVKIHGGDAINDIFQFTKRSIYKYISLGQTTVAYWDSRESNENDTDETPEEKRKVAISDDQEDEVLCGTFVDPESGDTVVCGMGEGILTVWRPDKNDLEDQFNRIKICKGDSIDAIIPTLQDDNCVWCGASNGKLYKVDVKRGQVVQMRNHAEMEDVGLLDLDYEYRLISAGMDSLLIWDLDSEEGEGSDDQNEDDSDSGDEVSEGPLSKEDLLKELEEKPEQIENDDKNSKDKPKSVKRKAQAQEKYKKNKRAATNGIAKFDDL